MSGWRSRLFYNPAGKRDFPFLAWPFSALFQYYSDARLQTKWLVP